MALWKSGAAAAGLPLFHRAIVKSFGGTYGGAHWALANRSAIIAHIALHHLIESRYILGNAEGAGHDAVLAANAARLLRRLDNAVWGLFNGIRRTHLGTGRIFAVHTNLWGRLHGVCAVDVVQMNHGRAAMRVAFTAGLKASLAADAPGWIDNENIFQAGVLRWRT